MSDLEVTQEMAPYDMLSGASLSGVFHVVRDDEGGSDYVVLQRDASLSARYSTPRIDFTRRQAE